ncbi:MAG TPA: 2-oxo-4-hydroxy-4-carboxy-5-ureidoimidazoline decarboxylase [Candidatus Dormibacteraeota bacterium]|nr:2-oxo-4-hydroxy-4-carboxy-5-ureidoimidazoline decarboxylase [Candidatus Dormibacteraeota bacterium]
MRNQDLERFNGLPREEAEGALLACFANHEWSARMAAGRPYRDVDQVLAAAEQAWTGLKPGDWLRAFAAHPRIGERGGHAPASSDREQAAVTQASAATRAALAAENREYEERFGHVFLISASGRGADEILHALRQRMKNDPFRELEVAAAEQRKITRLRLLALLNA